eukprot:85508-Hanusia_phi.AAC.2
MGWGHLRDGSQPGGRLQFWRSMLSRTGAIPVQSRGGKQVDGSRRGSPYRAYPADKRPGT